MPLYVCHTLDSKNYAPEQSLSSSHTLRPIPFDSNVQLTGQDSRIQLNEQEVARPSRMLRSASF